MSIIARRFAIFTLIIVVFAVSFSAIVAHPSRKEMRLHTGLAGMDISSCLSETNCPAAIG